MKESSLSQVQYAMNKINGKWKVPILMCLHVHGCMRFNELQKEIDGIGSKMLSKELKELEKTGLLIREVETTAPIKVTYSLSIYGKTLDKVFEALSQWGAMHKFKDDKNDDDIHRLNHKHIITI